MVEYGRATRRAFLQATGSLAGAYGIASGIGGAATIDPTLRDASGETDVIVRLDRAPLPADAERAPRERVVDRLKTHAEKRQAAVETALADRTGIEVSQRFWLANALAVTVDTDAVALDALADLDAVERIHGTELAGGSASVGATRSAGDTTQGTAPQADIFDEQDVSWVLDLLNVPEVWDRYDTRGEGARVAILDTGVDTSHPDIDLDGWAEFDAQGQRVDSEPSEVDQGVGHGTWTSTLATGGDASGMAIGVAPDAELYVAGFGAEYNFPAVMAGLEWAVENDADVASMSVTMETRWLDVIEPVENAVSAGTLPVTAVEWPIPFLANATTPTMLVTAPITRELVPRQGKNGGRIRWERALRGFDVPEEWPAESFVPDVSLPGEEVPSGVSGPQFPDQNWTENGRGASATPPFAAGIVALLQSATDGSLSPAELRETFRETAFRPEDANGSVPNTRLGYGIPDAARAVARHVDGDRTVSGVVTDGEGSPVEGATVRAASGAEATTDSDGSYALSVPEGEETLTVNAVGYEPVETAVAAGASTADASFDAQVEPAIGRVEREPTRLAPGETLALEFAVEHADAARLALESSGRRVDPADFGVSINGTSTAMGRETRLESDPSTLRVEIAAHEDARGVARLAVGVASLAGEEPVTTDLPLEPVHVHEQPLTVADGEDLQQAVDAAEPGTRVELADSEWTLDVGPFDPTFEDSLLNYPPAEPVLAPAGDDEAALVVDKPLTLTARSGADPTLTVGDAGSADRAVALRIGAPNVTVEDIAIDAGGTMAGVSVLNSVGTTVENVAVDDARHGLLGELTLSLLARSNEFRAREAGISLEWLGWNALLADNDIRDADRGIVLNSGFFISGVRLDGNRFDGVSTEVSTSGEGELSYDRAEGDTDGTDGTDDDSDTGAEGGTDDTDGSDDAATTADGTTETGDGGAETPAGTPVVGDTSSPGEDGPGFGVASSLGGIAGLGYLLRRRLNEDDSDR